MFDTFAAFGNMSGSHDGGVRNVRPMSMRLIVRT